MNFASLSFPERGVPLVLVCDASNVDVDATLNQVVDGESQPLRFFFETLTKTQRNSLTFNWKLLQFF